MSTKTELIARIVDDPSDTAAYLVYADWLLERGDPHGELIVMHVNGRDDATLRRKLLGTLVQHGAQLTFEWTFGFVRGVQIVTATTEQAMQLVSAVVAAPVCRVLQRLRVVVMSGADYQRIDRWLVFQSRPTTLEDVVLGAQGEHALSRMLYAAFPRLRGV